MWLAAEVAVGRGAGDDAGRGIDAQAGRQGGRIGQSIAGGRSGEVAGDIEAEALPLVGALVGNGSCSRAGVAVSTARLKPLADGAAPWASVAVMVIGLLPKSLSVGVPEMMPVWASMLRPVGRVAV